MALFKISKGSSTNLPSKITEGYCYVTTDENKFYVDISGTKRIALNAATADKVSEALSIQLNGGSAITFDGSVEKSINITPAAIGAATSSHTHNYLPLSGGTLTGNLIIQGSDFPGLTLVNTSGKELGELSASVASGSISLLVNSGNDIYESYDFQTDGVFHCTTIKLEDALGIAYGGTGATDAATARTNLGIDTVISNAVAKYLPLTGGTVSGSTTFASNLYVSNNNSTSGYVKMWEDNEGGNIEIASPNGKTFQIDAYNDTSLRIFSQQSGSVKSMSFNGSTGELTANKVYGAVWNDYAEFRASAEQVMSGQVVYSDNRGELHKTTERLQAFEGVVSDTFGFAIGETDRAKTPLAVAGRVLVYPDEDRYTFHAGDAVCAGKFGTVSKMTREEIIAYPDRIVGIVSEIPEYETWGSGNIKVYNRIWIRIK